MNKPNHNVRQASCRLVACQTLTQLLRNNLSLASLLPKALERVADSDRGLLQELCYGSLRWFPQLNLYLNHLLDKPFKAKDSDLQALLLIGLYQLLYTRIPDHAAISQTVEVSKQLKKHWATKLVNGVMRQMQRNKEAIIEQFDDNPCARYGHPKWMIKAIESAWPDCADNLLDANNQHPPFTLRLNTHKCSRSDYLAELQQQGLEAQETSYSPYGITLSRATDVYQLPRFREGEVSVQDEAAQLAADLLQLQPHQRVLDACCAPGGKTGHILERQPLLEAVTALDADAKRLERVQENFERLAVHNHQAEISLVCGDAAQPDQWWDGQTFDRILLDAPCSATGVIRRHPDIKLLRKPADIDKLASLQAEILTALWTLLKPSGRLVYATCSVMPAENSQLIEAFVAQQPDAHCLELDVDWGMTQTCGRQLLPQTHDGFYYAVLEKKP